MRLRFGRGQGQGARELRLTWIWGTPRSGSTWLLEQLCDPLAPDVRAPAGFKVRPGSGASEAQRDLVPIDEPFIANHLAPALGDPVELDDGSLVPATPNNYLGGNPGYSLARSQLDAWQPGFRDLALRRLQSLLDRAREVGVELDPDAALVIKEVNGSHASDLVMAMFPDSRMLFLARDGRDVVDSLLHGYAPGGFLARNQGWAIDSPDKRAEAFDWACRLWACNVDVTLRAYDAHDPSRRRIVRYEDLVAACARELSSTLEWLGVERSAARVGEVVAAHDFDSVPAARRGPKTRQRAASPGLWKEHLSPEEQATAGEILGPRLQRLGYTV